MFPLQQARERAIKLVETMRPYCERVEIGGSIRREVESVKDIEIVAVPKMEFAPVEDQVRDLFGSPPKAPENVNLLHFWAVKSSGVRWIKTGTRDIVDWQPKPDAKYYRGLLTCGMKLDLFLATPENFGLIFAIRTGSKDFTAALVTHARTVGFPSVDGYLTRSLGDGSTERIATPDEQTVFEVLGLEYVEPRDRQGWESLRVAE